MRRILTIISAIAITAVAQAQTGSFFQGQSVSPNQKLIEEALSDAFRIVRFEFQLEDTTSHEKFNLSGKDFFGVAEGLCVNTCEGWIAPSSTLTPWSNNLEVKQYPEYKPVFSVASVLYPADTVWKPLEIRALPESKKIPGTSCSSVADTSVFGPGLSLGTLEEENEGWIVWVTRDGNKVAATSYSHRVVLSDSTSFGLGRKVIPSGVVGGFYVKPVNPSVGVIRFDLAGLMEKGIDGWKVVPFNADKVQVKKPTIVPDKPKLVPAGENKQVDVNAVPPKDKNNKKEKKNK